MSVLVRTPTTVVPRAVAAACAVAPGIGSRTLTHTITSAAHAHALWHGPRLGQGVSGRVKTVSKDCIIFHLCIGLGAWLAASAQRCRGLPLAHHTPRVAYGHHRTARGPLPGEQGDAGGNCKTPVEWPGLCTCHSNPEKLPYAPQTATRHG